MGLLDVSLGILRVLKRCSGILINLNKVDSLFMHLGVNLLGDVVDICHKLFNVVQLFLPLLDDVFHVGGLALHFQLFNIQLLLLKESLAVMVVQAARALVIHQ